MLHIDAGRCIECEACAAACSQVGFRKGTSVMWLVSVGSSEARKIPFTCLHCENAPCARACPTEAIKLTGRGIVLTADESRCIACRNCVVACPFGIPVLQENGYTMVKCDLCFDRLQSGSGPLCVAVCPTEAIRFQPPEALSLDKRLSVVERFAGSTSILAPP